jgi:hypothetical protein
LYWRRYKKGCTGFVAVRKSHWGPFPHFLYVRLNPKRNTWRFVSFVPLAPERKMFPPLFFQGRVRWGDVPKPGPAPVAGAMEHLVDEDQVEQLSGAAS